MSENGKFIEKLGRLPTHARLEIKEAVNNESRKGNYIVITSGMIIESWFVGLDKDHEMIIAEYVGP
jgi:hypothetical protein